MTGVNRFHRKFPNFDGRGIKVGIIDTGIDYTHEALGGCFGSTCRVAFGSDFADEDLDPMDWYVHPLKKCYNLFSDGHGTHVGKLGSLY